MVLNDEMPFFHLSLIRERVSNLNNIDYYARKYPVQYIVFDLLSIDDNIITHKPLGERSLLLKENLNISTAVTITDDFTDGNMLFS